MVQSGGFGSLLCLRWLIYILAVGGVITEARAWRVQESEKPSTITEHCANDGCHAAITQRKVMHGPVAQKKCLACHEHDEPREHTFRLASPADQLCADCHTLQHRTVVHEPVRQGNCTGCHDPHGSEHRAILLADPTRGLCLSCHQEESFKQKKFVHGPAAAGACILCHEPHSGWQEKLLVEAPDKLCIGCHAEVLPKGVQDRYVHAPVKDNCMGCHDAHASDHKFHLHDATPGLCLSCHEDVATAMASSRLVHGALLQADGCTTCHASHFSQLPSLQRVTQPQSCLNCHDRPIEAVDGQMLTNIAALLMSNPQQHGPIREGECSACHQPHAGDKFRLLAADYPPEFYAPFDIEQYALCFNCHIPELVQKQQGTGLTRFRVGEMNLHWLHVNQEKGRTCRACHEVHASSHPFHMRDAVPFGDRGWMLEINYQQSETGGSCSPGCHVTASYDHGEESRSE